MKKLMNIRLKQEVKPAICKSQNGESGNGMRGMMGTRAIRVGKQRIKVGMRWTRVGMRGMGVGMLGMREMRGIRVRIPGIRVIFFENLRVYCVGENPGARGEHFTIQLLWATARLLVTPILPCLPSGWVLLQGNETLLCFFDSNVGILNIIMLIQILLCQNCKQHVRSRLAVHSMICCSANLSVREID